MFKVFENMGVNLELNMEKHDFDLKKIVGGSLCGDKFILIEGSHVFNFHI
ncbi:hypothetical protein GILI108418_14355 [Gillisia limnaea]|uniref:Uncharacterized protein n=1 Tax=Gillisia limnaea (strain DSM 15749 / LMG 21470 / R-8282) TaxID=865937 RepID=H2BW77_GILLR|nr:hypothetical protein Gilli_3442 [Gillisia limnaea DSM 15749]